MSSTYINWKIRLKKGMSIDEITPIIGYPQKVDSGEYITVWHYDYPGGGKIYLDKNNQLSEWDVPPDKRYYEKIEKIENSGLENEDTEDEIPFHGSPIKDDDSKYDFESNKKETQNKHNKKSNFESKMGNILELKGKVNWREIKIQYRRLMQEYHPDKVSHLGKEIKDLSKNKTIEIREAYEYFKEKYGGK